MATGLALDERFLLHETGAGHPERPQRLAAIRKRLHESGLASRCANLSVEPISRERILSNHSETYLDRLARACVEGRPYIDVPDSAICPASLTVAELAAGSVIRGVQEVMSGTLANAFCAVRPPGHHAEYDHSMGFCLLNNIALAARLLLDHHRLDRILILDWDVHHGNGTQHSFEESPEVLFISLHGHPKFVYPGTGYEHERGRGRGEGYTINVPILPPGRDPVWRRAFEEKILPAVDSYRPQFVLVSAGFDAHRLDPLAPLELETESYEWMTELALDIARRHAAGRLVSVLEGGYHLDALADCVALHVGRLVAGQHSPSPSG